MTTYPFGVDPPTFISIEVPGIGVVNAQVVWEYDTGVWQSADGSVEAFDTRGRFHPCSITSRVIREAKRVALQGNLR